MSNPNATLEAFKEFRTHYLDTDTELLPWQVEFVERFLSADPDDRFIILQPRRFDPLITTLRQFILTLLDLKDGDG